MNKLRNLLASSTLLFASTCFAQWNPGSADHTVNIFRSGNVALGTASAVPEVKLFVSSTTNSGGDNTMRLEAPNIGTIPSHIHWGTTGDWYIRSATTNGKVIIQDTGGGIGLGSVGTLRGKLDVSVQGDMYFSVDANSGSTQSIYLPGHIFIAPYQGSNISYLQARRQNNSGTTALQIRTYNAGTLTEALRIEGNGNVGIGTTDPGSFKLAVNGKIWSQEVNVAMTNPGPDYVFEPDYNLLSLSELETYITQNKHLPEVPSAKEMENEGLNLKEMNLILLRKIEELTLHLIEQNKKSDEQRSDLDHIKQENKKMKEQIVVLERKEKKIK